VLHEHRPTILGLQTDMIRQFPMPEKKVTGPHHDSVLEGLDACPLRTETLRALTLLLPFGTEKALNYSARFMSPFLLITHFIIHTQ